MIYDDPRGMRHYTQTLLMGLDELQEMGRIHDRNQPDFDGEIDKGASDDISIMLSTRHHRQAQGRARPTAPSSLLDRAARSSSTSSPTRRTSRPTCRWPGSATTCSSFAQATVAGYFINCPESGETVMNDLREIGPTYYFAPPRVFENLLTQVMIRMEDAGSPKRKIFHHFMDVARRCGADILDGKPVSAATSPTGWQTC